MANKQNLHPIRSKDEARERGRMGGKASGEARRERKALRDNLLLLLASPMKDADGKPTGKTVQEEILFALVQRAMTGDPRAFELIRDTIGEKPVQEISVGTPDFSALDEAFAAMDRGGSVASEQENNRQNGG